MIPIDTNRVVVGKVSANQSHFANGIAADSPAKTIEGYRSVMARKAKSGGTSGLFGRNNQCRAVIKSEICNGNFMIPQRGTDLSIIGIMRSMTGLADFIVTPAKTGKIMFSTPNIPQRNTGE